MNVLFLDIESAPHRVFCWGTWAQDIRLDQMIDSSYTLCYSAKTEGSSKVVFDSIHQSSAKKMLTGIHSLLDKADVVVSYNGRKFDLPTLNRDFILHGLPPPSPYKQVDLLQVVRRQFRFASNKLDYVCQALGLGAKVKHAGFKLWVDCMEGLDPAWKQMRSYNIADTLLLEKLYYRLLPWIPNHPNLNVYNEKDGCPRCGSTKIQSRGTSVSTTLKYRRYQCMECGGWLQGERIKLPKTKYKGIH